jgi:hypothetical protein
MHANENGHRGSAIPGTVLMLAAMESRVLRLGILRPYGS